MEVNIGDEITLCGKVIDVIRWYHDKSAAEVTLRLKSGQIIIIEPADIKSIHPYKEIPKDDMRKGN